MGVKSIRRFEFTCDNDNCNNIENFDTIKDDIFVAIRIANKHGWMWIEEYSTMKAARFLCPCCSKNYQKNE